MFCIPGLVRYFWNHAPDAFLSVLREANIIAVVTHRLAGSQSRVIVSERGVMPIGVEWRRLRNRLRFWLM